MFNKDDFHERRWNQRSPRHIRSLFLHVGDVKIPIECRKDGNNNNSWGIYVDKIGKYYSNFHHIGRHNWIYPTGIMIDVWRLSTIVAVINSPNEYSMKNVKSYPEANNGFRHDLVKYIFQEVNK